jgi:hypothetical protein
MSVTFAHLISTSGPFVTGLVATRYPLRCETGTTEEGFDSLLDRTCDIATTQGTVLGSPADSGSSCQAMAVLLKLLLLKSIFISRWSI